MESAANIVSRARTLTFDCYGTLIDWYGGLRRSFADIFGPEVKGRFDEFVAAYVRIEAQVESEPYRTYREILRLTVEQMGRELDLPLANGRSRLLADQLPTWVPFPDTTEALLRLKNRFRLGILSNIDGDLLAATARQFGVAFDFTVTAEDVQSYKPGRGHFDRLLERHAARDTVVHVAQSLFHDGTAANRHGLAFVWINRYRDSPDASVPMIREYPDLRSLADEFCGA